MYWIVLTFFAFVLWPLGTVRETTMALAAFPLWLVIVVAG